MSLNQYQTNKLQGSFEKSQNHEFQEDDGFKA